ncbi:MULTISPECIES: Asp23/Gls24 family envelope stress response protein [unclassified Rothia (in: high G+C Gram-positive bacteria)]|uniref:Asp23/Gls24 family envelope stress response protein n=1 Tax=unclassified Rothia (in: high G+C Gram-positive bacteria) TaxID=2689056 RepID=UPI001957E455|nr:Asp23/Gls24 family envelope stress response protein [Rothia sp. ZJ932]MBM7051725.1 Asp23/Gls24 family envelope stress response protein [Rothia sp. ZJ1223]QRZ61654.1 Asp23/Gls24 family envelope stress response protein [Rothia sp. ZJ932]
MNSNHIPLEDLSIWLDDEHSGIAGAEHQRRGKHIENCPTCTQRFEALQRLERATQELIDEDENTQTAHVGWVETLLENLILETKAGRAIPLTGDHPLDTLSVTEGAILSATRRAGESVSGVLVGKVRLHGDIETPDAEITLEMNISVRQNTAVPDAAQQVRARVLEEIDRTSELNLVAVDITVEDVHSPATELNAKPEEPPHA